MSSYPRLIRDLVQEITSQKNPSSVQNDTNGFSWNEDVTHALDIVTPVQAVAATEQNGNSGPKILLIKQEDNGKVI